MNNSAIGFTFQKIVCDKFKIIPDSLKAQKLFKTNYISALDGYLSIVVEKIFYMSTISHIKNYLKMHVMNISIKKMIEVINGMHGEIV